MTRKHKGVHQSGENAGRLKKGFIFTGLKSKNGLPLIKRVKKKAKKIKKNKQKQKKKTMTGGENRCQEVYDTCHSKERVRGGPVPSISPEKDAYDRAVCKAKRLECERDAARHRAKETAVVMEQCLKDYNACKKEFSSNDAKCISKLAKCKKYHKYAIEVHEAATVVAVALEAATGEVVRLGGLHRQQEAREAALQADSHNDETFGVAFPTVGVHVDARWQDGNYYPGVIQTVHADDTFDIAFDDGDFQANVPRIALHRRSN